MLAIVVCLGEWWVYFEGAQPPTKIYTNYLNLTYFTTTKALNSRQVRWSKKLEEYNFKIIYRPEHANLKVDLLLQRKDYMAESYKEYKIL